MNWLIQNRKSQASDILKFKAKILEEFEWNILEVLNGFLSALQKVLNNLHVHLTLIGEFAKKRLQIQNRRRLLLAKIQLTGIQIGLKVHNNDNPGLSGHLSITDKYLQSLECPLYTGFPVY